MCSVTNKTCEKRLKNSQSNIKCLQVLEECLNSKWKKKTFSVERKNCEIKKSPFCFLIALMFTIWFLLYSPASTFAFQPYKPLFRIPSALVSLNSKACFAKLRNQHNDVASLYGAFWFRSNRTSLWHSFWNGEERFWKRRKMQVSVVFISDVTAFLSTRFSFIIESGGKCGFAIVVLVSRTMGENLWVCSHSHFKCVSISKLRIIFGIYLNELDGQKRIITSLMSYDRTRNH